MNTKKTKNELTIYTNETCPYCKQVKEELEKNNFKLNNKITGENSEEWGRVVTLTNMTSVPTILYKDNYFVPARDFSNPEHLIKILENFEPSKFSWDRHGFEMTRTLNYNMAIAFQRLDQSIKTIEKNYRELFEEEQTKTD